MLVCVCVCVGDVPAFGCINEHNSMLFVYCLTLFINIVSHSLCVCARFHGAHDVADGDYGDSTHTFMYSFKFTRVTKIECR